MLLGYANTPILASFKLFSGKTIFSSFAYFNRSGHQPKKILKNYAQIKENNLINKTTEMNTID
jgi:hypothetical protein